MSDPSAATASLRPGSELKAAATGLAALLVGVGLARFAYTPLIPALVKAGWLGPADAAYLGAANLVGYLVGAVAARPILRLWPARPVLRLSMALAAIAFIACTLRLGFAWFLPWRFLAGVVGAVLMIGAPSTVLSVVSPERRGRYGGLVFTGVGLGIAASGTLVPLMLAAGGLPLAWLGLGAVSLLLTILVWRWWPDPGTAPRAGVERPGPPSGAVMLVIGIYALAALGVVPHMLFLVDFVARGLGRGIASGAAFWVLFGLGAMVGPLATGRLADRIGFQRAIRICLVIELLGVLAVRIDHSTAPLVVSAVVVGAMTPGFPPLILGRLQAVRGRLEPSAVWGLATIAFAIAQAIGAYGLSFLYARTASYALLFDLALAAGMLGMVLALLDRRR